MTTFRPSGPPVNREYERWVRSVYASALTHLVQPPSSAAEMQTRAVSLQLVVAWTGLGGRELHRRAMHSFIANGRAIARGHAAELALALLRDMDEGEVRDAT